MSVSIRLSRVGHKHDLIYRIIATPTRSKRDGKNLEIMGSYNPTLKTLQINKDELEVWVKKGAIISPTVKRILEKYKK